MSEEGGGMARNALCIGINDYPGTASDLSGCVNDAHDWIAALKGRGFTVASLLDGQATKARMVGAMQKLVKGAAKGDSLVITYSGHGTWVPDQSGDEPDGRDEGLCPHDIGQGKVLLDDEIREIFEARAPGVKIVLISDSCHSGTVIRMARREAEATGPRLRFLPPELWMPREQLPRTSSGGLPRSLAPPAMTGGLSLAGGDLLMAGCKDAEYSYDAAFGGRPNGAFTYYALKTLKSLPPGANYSDWQRAIRGCLPSASYPQSPQLFGGRRARRFKVLE
jgi:hypothetical protein